MTYLEIEPKRERRKELEAVKKGQVWSDADKRNSDRLLVVTKVEGAYVLCRSFSLSRTNEVKLLRRTRIRHDRFRYTATGYIRRPSHDHLFEGVL
jgi:hypothetical protein